MLKHLESKLQLAFGQCLYIRWSVWQRNDSTLFLTHVYGIATLAFCLVSMFLCICNIWCHALIPILYSPKVLTKVRLHNEINQEILNHYIFSPVIQMWHQAFCTPTWVYTKGILPVRINVEATLRTIRACTENSVSSIYFYLNKNKSCGISS